MFGALFLLYRRLDVVLGLPSGNLGLSQTLDVLGGVDGLGATVDVDKELAVSGLVQALLVAGGIAELATGVLADQLSVLGIVLNLADDLLHGRKLLSSEWIKRFFFCPINYSTLFIDFQWIACYNRFLARPFLLYLLHKIEARFCTFPMIAFNKRFVL